MIDWREYLPPKPLPNTGDKFLPVDGVFGYSCAENEECYVLHVTGAGSAHILATNRGAGSVGELINFAPKGWRHKHAIYITQIDAVEFPDPDLIYQFLYT